MPVRVHTLIDSPCGPLTLVATDGVLSGLYMTDRRHQPPLETFGERDEVPFAAAIDQLAEYFDGRRTDFSGLPIHLSGTPFQRRVWEELRSIPHAVTISYWQLAEAIGQPSAARAVGLANGKNPISIVVPCHRVIGSTSSLTGYGGGLQRKRQLLDFERGRIQCLDGGFVADATEQAAQEQLF